MSSADSPPASCPECKSPLNHGGAKRCGACGVILNPWKRWLLHVYALAAAVAVFVPLWQIAGSFRSLEGTPPLAVSVTPVRCTERAITLELFNFEPDAVRVVSMKMTSLEAQAADMLLYPDPDEAFQFLRSDDDKRIRFLLGEANGLGIAMSCATGGCRAEFELFLRTVHGTRETRYPVRCALSGGGGDPPPRWKAAVSPPAAFLP